MRMIDIQWMMEHWPRLRYVYGGNLSAKRSRTFENLYVRDYLLHQALWMREIRGPNNSPEEFKRIGKKGCVHDSDSECDSDED
ncbi:hypothetical protein B0O80DRAFT_445583 [Mortierella sp. GBAus27b]|nr:hypothetical protein B0O80DRAFT_445583 [Mortierella sp. GBAus27b]